MISANDLLEELEQMDPTDPQFQIKFKQYRQLGQQKSQAKKITEPAKNIDYTKKMYASPNKQAQKQMAKNKQFRKDHHLVPKKPEPLIKNDTPGFDELKQTLKKVQAKHPSDPLAAYSVAVNDAKKLATNLKDISLSNPYAKRITQDLDQDLVKLDEIHSIQFKDTKEKTLHVLHQFDKKAKEQGLEVPIRQIDKLNKKAEIEKEKLHQYPTIDELPDKKPADTHGLRF